MVYYSQYKHNYTNNNCEHNISRSYSHIRAKEGHLINGKKSVLLLLLLLTVVYLLLPSFVAFKIRIYLTE